MRWTLAAHLVALCAPVGAQELTSISGPTPGLRVEAGVILADYCVDPPDSDVFTLTLTIELTATNTTDTRIILPKQPQAGSPRVAASVELGTQGIVVLQYDFHGFPPPRQLPSSRGPPDPSQFAILKPGQSHGAHVNAGVFVRRKAGAFVPGTLPDDSAFVIQVPIEWWAPFVGNSDDRIAALWRGWRPYGKLVTGTSETKWMEFSTPVIGNVKPCSATDDEAGVVRGPGGIRRSGGCSGDALEEKLFAPPADPMQPAPRRVRLELGEEAHDRVVGLSDDCSALLRGDGLVGFVARRFVAASEPRLWPRAVDAGGTRRSR